MSDEIGIPVKLPNTANGNEIVKALEEAASQCDYTFSDNTENQFVPGSVKEEIDTHHVQIIASEKGRFWNQRITLKSSIQNQDCEQINLAIEKFSFPTLLHIALGFLPLLVGIFFSPMLTGAWAFGIIFSLIYFVIILLVIPTSGQYATKTTDWDFKKLRPYFHTLLEQFYEQFPNTEPEKTTSA